MQENDALPMEITLSNVKLALLRIRVCGEDAGLLDGAIKGVSAALDAIKKAKAWEKEQKEKEEAKHADRADRIEQREDV